MKYCPYCGTVLPTGAVSFCPECGTALPGERKSDTQPEPHACKPVEKKARLKEKGGKASQPAQEACADKALAENDGYDGYYDDILPGDEGGQREGLDRSIVKKTALLLGGLAAAIGICVALLYLL